MWLPKKLRRRSIMCRASFWVLAVSSCPFLWILKYGTIHSLECNHVGLTCLCFEMPTATFWHMFGFLLPSTGWEAFEYLYNNLGKRVTMHGSM